MSKKRKFSRRIYFNFNIIYLIGMIIIFAFTIFVVRFYLNEEASDKLVFMSQSYAYKLEQRFIEVKNMVFTLNSVIRNYFDSEEYEKNDMEYIKSFENELKNLIKETTEEIPDTRTVYFYFNPDYFNMHYNISYAFLDSDEAVRLRILPATAYDENDPEMQWFFKPLKERKGIWSLPYYWELFKTEIVTYSEPVIKDGKVMGVIGLDFDFTDLEKMVYDLKVYENGYAYLLNEDFQFIVHPFLTVYDNLRTLENLDSEKIINILSEYSTGKATYNYSNSDKMFGFTKLANGWILGISAPLSDLQRPLNEVITFILIITLIMIVVFNLISALLIKRITSPLKLISASMKEFREDNMEFRMVENGDSELVEIVSSFNFMADKLQKSFETLKENKERIKESKETIEESNRELEASYKQIEYLANGLTRIFSIVSKISKSATENDETLLNDILISLMSLVNCADYGTISLFEKENWNFTYAVGHDRQKLLELRIAKKNFQPKEDTFIIYKENSNGLLWPEDLFSKIESDELAKALLPVKSSIISFLKIGSAYVGCMTVDISKDSKDKFGDEDIKIVSAFASLAASFLTMKKYLISKEKFQKDIILSMIKLVELYDPFTRGHSEVVASISSMIGRKIGLSSDEVSALYWSGLVHDIGKILIPPAILTKPGRLNAEEFEIVKRHPSLGAEVLKASEELQEISSIVLHHHEKWDGSGYPYGLKGEDIPLQARIVSVADALDAMVSERPYRDAMTLEEAFEELKKCSGKQFDPYIISLIEYHDLYREIISKIHKSY